MAYRDPVEEFERLNKSLNEGFMDFFNKGKNYATPKPKPSSRQERKLQQQNKEQLLQKYREKYSGTERVYGTERDLPFPIKKFTPTNLKLSVEVLTSTQKLEYEKFIKDINSGILFTNFKRLKNLLTHGEQDETDKETAEPLKKYVRDFKKTIVDNLIGYKQGKKDEGISKLVQDKLWAEVLKLLNLESNLAINRLKPNTGTYKPAKPTTTAITSPMAPVVTPASSSRILPATEGLKRLRKMVIECLGS